MNIIISLIYAPLVFLSLRYFDIELVSIVLFISSCIWFSFTIRKSYRESLYPFLYILLSLCTYFLKDFLVLKAMPLIISSIFTIIIFISYLNKKSVILYFAKKFSKKEISQKEEEYIHKSTLFWVIISCINIYIHFLIFQSENINSWIFYSSFGWYFLFIFAGILQYLHRKFIFLKGLHE